MWRETPVIVKRLEIGIVACQSTVFWVEGDGPLEVRHRFGVLVALGVRDRQHVDGVVVVRILISHEAKMGDGRVVLAAVDVEGGGVETLVDGLRSRPARCDLALADVEVEANAFVELFLFRVLAEDRFQDARGLRVIVTL